MQDFAKQKSKARLQTAVLAIVIILLCAGLILAGAIIPAIVVFLLCVILILGANFLFDFTINRNGRFTLTSLFEKGAVKDAEDQTAAQTGETAQAWKAWRRTAMEWLDSRQVEISVKSVDGLTLRACSFPQEGHLYAILCHGYASKPAHLAGTARKFYDMGFSVLMPSARGHGESEGRYFGLGWLDRMDLLMWIRNIVDIDPEAEILLFGVSMGGATVMMVSGEKLPENVKCIIEDCGYSSVLDEFTLQMKNMFHLPAFPMLNIADLICRFRAGYSFHEASSVAQLKKAKVPMLFIHGEEDVFVPYSMLDVVYEACASGDKAKLSVPGGAHAQSVSTDPELYWKGVTAFVERQFNLKTQ